MSAFSIARYLRSVSVDLNSKYPSDLVHLSLFVRLFSALSVIGFWFSRNNIGNILILRGNIEILPASRTTVSYEFLSQLVAEYLLLNAPDVDISMALTMMPLTTSACR